MYRPATGSGTFPSDPRRRPSRASHLQLQVKFYSRRIPRVDDSPQFGWKSSEGNLRCGSRTALRRVTEHLPIGTNVIGPDGVPHRRRLQLQPASGPVSARDGLGGALSGGSFGLQLRAQLAIIPVLAGSARRDRIVCSLQAAVQRHPAFVPWASCSSASRGVGSGVSSGVNRQTGVVTGESR